jgi:hypothetical protein
VRPPCHLGIWRAVIDATGGIQPVPFVKMCRGHRDNDATGHRRGGGAGGASRRLGLALLLIATAQLMVVLDGTIVNVALPHIQRALGFSGTGPEWVVNAYALAFGGLLLGGRCRAAGESGVASSLLNAGQQVGGSIGLAVLGTAASTSAAPP